MKTESAGPCGYAWRAILVIASLYATIRLGDALFGPFGPAPPLDGSQQAGHCTHLTRPNGTAVYFGNGCFWERQWAYVRVEREVLHRTLDGVSSVTGYAGGHSAAQDTVCYHTASPSTDYEALGHAEVVGVTLDPRLAAEQFAAIAADFFSSFRGEAGHRSRPDPMDRGSP